jgi:hypothetical protein
LPMKFSVGQNFRSHEYFVRTRFAQQMFRRTLNSAIHCWRGAGNSSADSPRVFPDTVRKAAALSSWRLIATFTLRRRHYRGFPVRASVEAFRRLPKSLFQRENCVGLGWLVQCRPPTAAAPIACFLRNTFPKTAPGACVWGCSSLHVGTPRLRWRCDGGGNPKSSQPEDRG